MSGYNPNRSPNPAAKWLATASAVFVGTLAAGLVLLATVRFYVHYSIQEWGEKYRARTVDTRR